MIKKIGVIVFACICLLLSISVYASKYRDVLQEMWYYDDVMLATKDGILEGKSSDQFAPEENLKVSEAIAVISRAYAKMKSEHIEESTSGPWYEMYLTYAIAKGIADSNYSQTLEQNITRMEFAKLCFNVLKDEQNVEINSIEAIPDVDKGTEDYKKIETLYNLGVITGVDEYGTFCPDKHITRAEMAAVLNRIYYPERRIEKEFKTLESLRHAEFKKRVEEEICAQGKIFVNCDKQFVSQENLDKLQKEIKNFGGTCGFYLITLDGKFSMGYNIDQRIASASTVKAPFALYSMKETENGKGTFSEKITYEQKHYCTGGSVIRDSSKIGTEYSLEEVFYYTINFSDNVGYYMLQDKFGIAGYNEFLKKIGCSRMELTNNLRWGYIYPRETALIWNEIYNYSQTSEYGKKLFDLFVNAKYNFVKEAYLSKYPKLNYEIAHKSGFNKNGRHDSAIVLLDDVPYFVTITTKPKCDESEKKYLKNTVLILEIIMKEYAAEMSK